MSRIPGRLPIALLLLLIAAAAQAQDPSASPDSAATAGEHFAAGNAAFARDDFAAALVEFEAAIAAGSAGPAAYYNRAVCHYRLGDYAAAESAFRTLAREFPSMRPLADYNIGLALTRQQRLEPARDAFSRAAAAGDATVRSLAIAMLERLPATPNRASAAGFVGLLELRFGHDDNVALVDPLGLPAGQSAESPFGELVLVVDAPIGDAGHWRVMTDAFVIGYPDATSYDQSGLAVRARYERGVGDWDFAGGPDSGRTWVDGTAFEDYVGGVVSLSRPLDSIRATIGIELRRDQIDAAAARFAYIDGHRQQTSLRFDKRLQRARLSLTYRVRSEDREGNGVSSDQERVGLGIRRAFGESWLGDISLEYRHTQYARLSPARTERRSQIGLRAIRELSSAWRLSAEYSFADNRSSVDGFSYERHRLAFGTSRVF